MIIFGTRGCTSKVEQGNFFCPQCNGETGYTHKKVRRWFTLYFIPCIPLDQLGEYVECNTCQCTFVPRILEYDPAEADSSEGNVEAMFLVACKQTMIAMLLADGIIDDDEVQVLQDTFETLTGVEITEEDLREEIDAVAASGSNALEIIAEVGPHLNDAGKEMVMKCSYYIAMADGVVAVQEQQLLEQIGSGLELSKSHVRGILIELEEEYQRQQ